MLNLAAVGQLITVLSNFRPVLHFTPNGRRSLAGTCSSSVWNRSCCTWNGEVESDAVSRFNHTAVLTYDPCVISSDSPPQPHSRAESCVKALTEVIFCPTACSCNLRLPLTDGDRTSCRLVSVCFTRFGSIVPRAVIHSGLSVWCLCASLALAALFLVLSFILVFQSGVCVLHSLWQHCSSCCHSFWSFSLVSVCFTRFGSIVPRAVIHSGLYILKLNTLATFCNNAQVFKPRETTSTHYTWKGYSLVYLHSTCNQLLMYTTPRGGHVRNVPFVCRKYQFVSIT